MNTQKFEESVKNLAHKKVTTAIQIFREDLRDALSKLTDERYIVSKESDSNRHMAYKVLKNIVDAGDIGAMKGWPAKLWEIEKDKVRKDLFGMMDVMQKALIAPPPSVDDIKPENLD